MAAVPCYGGGKAKGSSEGHAAMLPLNAIGNCVFMTGIGLIPSFGPIGTGILSLIVAMASFAIPVIVLRFAAPCSQATTDWPDLAAVLRMGIPIGITTVLSSASSWGAADVAAHTLTLRTVGVVYGLPAALLRHRWYA